MPGQPRIIDIEPRRGKAKYTIEKVGSYYHVFKRDVLGLKSFPELATAFNSEVFNGLTAGRDFCETVEWAGNMTLTDTVLFPEYTRIEGAGSMTLANAVNKPMFTIADPCRGIELDGGSYFGNSTNQGAGDTWGFNAAQTTENTLKQSNSLTNCQFIDFKTTAIRLNRTGVYGYSIPWKLVNVYGFSPAGKGLEVEGITDSIFDVLHLGGGTRDLDFTGSVNCLWNLIYLEGGGMTGYGNTHQFNLVFVDHLTGFVAIDLNGVAQSTFTNFRIRKVGNADDGTYSAVYLHSNGADHCYGNTFGVFEFSHTVAARFNHGISEADANQDYNKYHAINAYTGVLAGLAVNKNGLNSNALYI